MRAVRSNMRPGMRVTVEETGRVGTYQGLDPVFRLPRVTFPGDRANITHCFGWEDLDLEQGDDA